MRVVTMNTELWFGKYKGYKAIEVAKRNPGYIRWIKNNLAGLSIEDSLYAVAVNVGIMESEYRADRYEEAMWCID